MTDDNFTRDDDVAEEEEEVDETVKSFRAVKDAVLFAIDRIISNPHDMMGVLLYGTESTKFYDEDGNTGGDLSYPHCYLFTDLDIPSAQEVKNLRALAGNEENARGILRPSSERVSMANVLFCANQIFTTKAPNFLSRRLFIVTDDDNPHQDNKSLRSAATVRARDLYDLSVNIELFPISRPDHEFDTSKFYDDIIYKPSPRDGEAPTYLQPDTKTPTGKGGGISLLNSLLSSINSRAVPRRSLFSNVPLEIGPNFKIAVNGYLLLKKQEPARSCYVWLGGEKPQIVKGITTHMADDTAQTVQKSEIRKAYKFGGEQVTFTPEELQALRNFGDPVIRIIGFKPLSALPIWANVKHPSFIYPSEDDFVGSTRVFSALHQKLLKDQKIAIVWFIPRKNSAPVVAAMIAGEERLDENGVQKVPPGMWLIPLPFVDDVRENPPAVLRVSPDNLTDAMRQVIGQLQLPRGAYDAQKYPNPALQWHYRILQALALDEDYPGEPEDKTKPKYRQIDKRAGDYVLEWSRLLDMIFDKMYGGQAATTSTLVKREARDAGEGASRPPAKRVKTEEPADLEEQVRQCYERGTLKKLTLHVLKSFLNAHGRATAGKKDDLIDQVEQYFERKN